ncbi:MAG TPA: DASS family sodium-coupled anion symporter [Gemmatimonadota bacterium]|nr:DASS family sodium-coupled anion symporter [Gemmatimonadota bacterium]
MTTAEYDWRKRIGLLAGPALFALVLLLPPPAGLAESGWRTAAVALWMAAWWIGEPIPLPATSLLPLVLFPLLGTSSIGDSAAPYADPLVFLFLGGFLIALAMERWGLHRRVALRIIRSVGTGPQRIVGGFMASTAFISMWVSNTATTLLLLPIGLSVVALADSGEERERDPAFAPALLIGIAFAASLGGLGTLIGTPPNALTAAFLQETYGVRIGFARWLLVGLPLLVIALPFAYLVLTRWVLRVRLETLPGGRALIEGELQRLGPVSRGERSVAAVFLLAAVLWTTSPVLVNHLPGLSDAGIAVGAGLLLFVLPVDLRRGVFVLEWRWAERLPWGVLLLFGGGLSLASAIDRSGLAGWMAERFAGSAGWPVLLLLAAVTVVVILFSELASNTATAAAFLPVVGALAVSAGMDPVLLVVPAGLAASGGFMLPVATPPNAIVYGTGRIDVPQLVRAGVLLDLLFVILVPLIGALLVPRILG